ncbi:hypothetical protein GLAREA_00085 [Glarea lozoyensis ATCC 20868]|uniref:Uncharacterized protein n=1 Tax=Glarea lozoyensis (strain ATCC 20868 / MF5171) TaxID=1116229 RepID=S3CR50_GLAL2|nr:uncharacterized protein GLAREA_00085 [Glarea lozoyensis ATCC 20868]EPE28927.1 hypothetical protein GLAREA_00085 [Glarea lozoyensis ATCC 20868]
MVLENSTASESDGGFTENPPPSAFDTYSGEGGKAEYDISMEGMPRPFPIIGPLFGYNDDLIARGVNSKTKSAGGVLQRHLTQEEMTAMVYWTSKQVKIMSYAPIIGIGGGLYRAYSTASTFRFPMYQPDQATFNREVFPHTRAPWVVGYRAVLSWHLARGFWYAAAGNFLAKMVIGSYALSVATVGEMQDPRLKDFISQVRQRQQQRRGGLEMPQGQNGRPGQPAPMPAPQKQDYDDASPTGGIYTEEDFQQSKPAVPVVPSRPAPAEAEAKSFDFFDDASPTGGQGISADTRAAPQSTGSAWDRLRRGQAPSQAPSQASSSQETQGSGRRDGQLDAQAEFDARIERERRGGDFSSNGGDIKRW